MANPLRGEVEFVHDGQRYTLRLDVNALCIAEAVTGLKSHEISRAIVNGGHMSALRAAFCAGLKANHDLSLDEAGQLLGAVRVPRATELMVRSIKLAFPEPSKANPRKAARGTGSSSTAAG